jgi:hypothetical protein
MPTLFLALATGKHGREHNVLLLAESFALKLTDGVGGRDWDAQSATFFQKPSFDTALAWWAWTINLV